MRGWVTTLVGGVAAAIAGTAKAATMWATYAGVLTTPLTISAGYDSWTYDSPDIKVIFAYDTDRGLKFVGSNYDLVEGGPNTGTIAPTPIDRAIIVLGDSKHYVDNDYGGLVGVLNYGTTDGSFEAESHGFSMTPGNSYNEAVTAVIRSLTLPTDLTTEAYILPSGPYAGMSQGHFSIIRLDHFGPAPNGITEFVSGDFAVRSLTISSTAPSYVPEPRTWFLMLTGAALVGWRLRYCRSSVGALASGA